MPDDSVQEERLNAPIRAERVLAAALSLPRADRERIAETLVASLDMEPALDHGWEPEIARRIDEVGSDSATLVPLDEVLRAGDDLLRDGATD